MKKVDPKLGSRRVEAWIYGVINPLVDALETETAVLGLRNVTFRRRNRRLEEIRPIKEHLTRGAVLILEDLAGTHPEVLRTSKNHDHLVGRLEAAARKAHADLMQDKDFETFASGTFAQVLAPETLVADVAEDVVNDRAETVNAKDGSYAEAWNRNLKTIRTFQKRRTMKELFQVATQLNDAIDRPLEALRSLRSDLVVEFDVPPAPWGHDSVPRP